MSRSLKLILVTEFPKSGGTWLCKMLSDLLMLDFPENELPQFRESIMHGHHLNSSKFSMPIVLVRDGRDVMVSYYYHLLLGNNEVSDRTVRRYRDRLKFDNYEDVRTNMPRFIRYMFSEYPNEMNRFSWAQFVRSYLERDEPKILVKYESLLSECSFELEKIVLQLGRVTPDTIEVDHIVSKYSFANMSKRKPGEEDKKSFLRKGVAGDWKNNFNLEAQQLFDHFAGRELSELGYV